MNIAEIYIGQQIVATEHNGDKLMGTVRSINDPFIHIWIEGDPPTKEYLFRAEELTSYVEVYASTNPSPNVYIGPSSDFIVKGLVTKWLNEGTTFDPNGPKNRDYPFDENDSFSWTVKEMLDLEGSL